MIGLYPRSHLFGQNGLDHYRLYNYVPSSYRPRYHNYFNPYDVNFHRNSLFSDPVPDYGNAEPSFFVLLNNLPTASDLEKKVDQSASKQAANHNAQVLESRGNDASLLKESASNQTTSWDSDEVHIQPSSNSIKEFKDLSEEKLDNAQQLESVSQNNSTRILANASSAVPSLRNLFLELKTDPDRYIVQVSIPKGIPKDQLSLSIKDRTLTVTAKNEHQSDYYRSRSRISRSVLLEQDSRTEDISALYDDGILSVTIPRKNVAQDSAKQIEID